MALNQAQDQLTQVHSDPAERGCDSHFLTPEQTQASFRIQQGQSSTRIQQNQQAHTPGPVGATRNQQREREIPAPWPGNKILVHRLKIGPVTNGFMFYFQSH